MTLNLISTIYLLLFRENIQINRLSEVFLNKHKHRYRLNRFSSLAFM